MLTDTAIRKARPKPKRYKLSDSGGLYVAVLPSGGKVFRYEYRFHGRRETLTLGKYSETGQGMTLAEARAEHARARRQVELGASPALEKKRAKQAAVLKVGTTFRGVSQRWLADFEPHRSAAWTRLARRWLNEANPVIGSQALSEISQADVLAACKKAQDRGSAYSAEAIRRCIASVFEYAAGRGLTDRNPARAARGAIVVPKTRELPSLTAKEIQSLVSAIRTSGGRPSTRIALELLLLTFVRKSELTRARWDELDLEAAEWRIPAHRMKMRELHIVPLSTQASALFERQLELASGSDFVFPSLSSLVKPLSDTALNNALNRLGYSHFSPHSFRRTASTMLNELGWRPDFIERQLAHQERSKVRAAYNKASYLPDRKRMMQGWADHVNSIVSGAVVIPIGSVAKSSQSNE